MLPGGLLHEPDRREKKELDPGNRRVDIGISGSRAYIVCAEGKYAGPLAFSPREKWTETKSA